MLRDPAQILFVAIGNEDARAFPHHAAGDGTADAAGAAGDQHPLSSKDDRHSYLPQLVFCSRGSIRRLTTSAPSERVSTNWIASAISSAWSISWLATA